MIEYKKRRKYKYTLQKEYCYSTGILPEESIETVFLAMDSRGLLTIGKGYAWDGPSGPARDTKNYMRGSLVHDALYQLMREGHLSREFRDQADRIMREICIDAGMSSFRASIAYWAVKHFAGHAAESQIRKAP